MTTLSRPRPSRLARALCAAGALAGALAVAPTAGAQQPEPAQRDTMRPAPVDSARPPAVITGADTSVRPELRPPISPRRAFLYSLAIPGSAQTVLGRPRAAGLFVLTELIALVMIRETGAELRDARAFATDSVLLGTAPGGAPVYGPGPFPRELVRARQAHLEDWIAFLLANHLFSGADAYVAAHLWDVPIQVRARPAAPGRFRVAATLSW